MVRFANVLALSLVLVGLSTSASPVINEQRDIERRTTSLSCGWAKKDGVDMGCMCKMPGLNLGIDLGGLNILDLGLKQYPPGCKPTCDDKVYECPYGKNGKGGCNEPHPCPPNQCESYGKCCPYGTINMQGTCCPKGCQVKEGQCYVPHPEPEPVPQCGENADYSKHEKKCVCKKGYEMFDYKCVKECGKDMYRNKEGHCVCNNHELKPDDKGVCRPQCHPPKILDPHKNMCKCPDHLVDDKKGGCMTPPPKCHEPKKLNHEKTACVCPEHLDDDGKGGCKPKPPVCHEPKKLNHEKTACVCPEHLDDDGKGGCKPKPPVCHEPKKLNHEKTACVCPEHLEDDGKGGCKAKPPMCKGGKKPDHYGNCVCPEHQMEDKHGKCFTPATCHYPYVQSHDKMSCVCGPDYDTKHDGSCKKKEEKPKPKPCGPGKKWCSTQCCRDDQEEKNGRCGCPSGYKEIPFLNTCEKLSILGINL